MEVALTMRLARSSRFVGLELLYRYQVSYHFVLRLLIVLATINKESHLSVLAKPYYGKGYSKQSTQEPKVVFDSRFVL
jgi:hypothetical protein